MSYVSNTVITESNSELRQSEIGENEQPSFYVEGDQSVNVSKDFNICP